MNICLAISPVDRGRPVLFDSTIISRISTVILESGRTSGRPRILYGVKDPSLHLLQS